MRKTAAEKADSEAEKAALLHLKKNLTKEIRHYVVNNGRTHKIVLTRWWTKTKAKTVFFNTAVRAWEFCVGEMGNRQDDRTLGLDYDTILDAKRAFLHISGTGKSLYDVADYFMRIGPGLRAVVTLTQAAKTFIDDLTVAGRNLRYRKGLAGNIGRVALPYKKGGLGDLPLWEYRPQTISDWIQAGILPPVRLATAEEDNAALVQGIENMDDRAKRLEWLRSLPTAWRKGWSLATAKNYYMSLWLLFKDAKARNSVGVNVMDSHELNAVRRLFEGLKGRIEIYTVDECRRLLETAEMNESQLDLLGFYATGLLGGPRVIELGRLQWQDIDLDRGHIVIRPEVVAKDGDPRHIPINDNLRAWLERVERREGDLLNHTNLARRIRALHRCAGVEHRQNAMRHSYSTFAYSRNPIPSEADKLREILGHKTDAVLFRFYSQLIQPEEAERFWKTMFPAPLTKAGKAAMKARRKQTKAAEELAELGRLEAVLQGGKANKSRRPNLNLVVHPEAVKIAKAEAREQEQAEKLMKGDGTGGWEILATKAAVSEYSEEKLANHPKIKARIKQVRKDVEKQARDISRRST